jgi:hypothetical protein
LCFLETGDLHEDVAEVYRIKGILKRVREWLAGRISRDSIEVELFAHFRNRSHDIEFLIPEIFFDEQGCKGWFYGGLPYLIATNHMADDSFKKVYIGMCIIPQTHAGIVLSPVVTASEHHALFTALPRRELFTDPGQSGLLQSKIQDKTLIGGFWWDIDCEPQPFNSITRLAGYVGRGNEENGIRKYY